MKGYMYILLCSNGSFYTGSTKDLQRRLNQHQDGTGAIHTSRYLPVKLIYFEEFNHVALAFKREKQVQKWSRAKKIALIHKNINKLEREAKNRKFPFYRFTE